MGGPSPWGAGSLSNNLGIPVLGSRTEETAPLPAGKSAETDRGTGEAVTLLTRSACVQRADNQGGESFAVAAATSLHSRSEGVNTLAGLTAHHSLA